MDDALGRALVELVTARQDWCHRKVETLHLRDGDRGRRRVSLDCTPPCDPRLARDGDVVLPLAFVTKGALRHLDVRDAAGRALPLLTRAESSRAAEHMLRSVLAGLLPPDVVHAPSVLPLVTRIVHEGPDRARAAVLELFGGEGQRGVLAAGVAGPAHALARTLSDCVLLLVLLPAGSAGRRQVIRYRFRWEMAAASRLAETPGSRLSGTSASVARAFGYGSVPVGVRIPGAADAASYSLEVHAPDGLTCVGLTLPSAPGAELRHDAGQGSVAHAGGRYPYGLRTDERAGTPRDVATVRLGVPRAGLRTTAAVASAVTAAVFAGAQALPGGRAGLDVQRESAVAVLLGLCALVLLLQAPRDASPVTGPLLLPLRVVVLLCAGSFAAGAASLAVGLAAPQVDVLWWSAAALATVMAVPLLASLPDVASAPAANAMDGGGTDPGPPGGRWSRRQVITTIEGPQHHAPTAAPPATSHPGRVTPETIGWGEAGPVLMSPK